MEIRIDILRRNSPLDKPYLQSVMYRYDNKAATAASALSEINSREGIKDINGAEVGRIRWECSCMQKKCGASAMVINGVPRLACGARLSEYEKNRAYNAERGPQIVPRDWTPHIKKGKWDENAQRDDFLKYFQLRKRQETVSEPIGGDH